MPVSESDLRNSHPEIPWDEPVSLRIVGKNGFVGFACRYCIALHGLKAADVRKGLAVGVFETYNDAAQHVSRHT